MIGILVLLAILVIAGTADARTLTDACGATVTVSADGSYSVSRADGFSATVKPLVPGDDAGALNTINAMRSASCPQPAAVTSPVISKAQFLARLGPKIVAIAAAAQTDAQMSVWLITAQSYDTINLADPLTKQGLDYLISKGLITSADETAILTP